MYGLTRLVTVGKCGIKTVPNHFYISSVPSNKL